MVANLKVPPNSIEAEESILGAILLEKDTLIKIADTLSAEAFYDSRHQTIYGAMLELYDKHLPIDLITLTDHLKSRDLLEQVGGAVYLTELVDRVPTSSHSLRYAELINQKYLLRKLISAGQDITAMAIDSTDDIAELLDQVESKIFAISEDQGKKDLVRLRDILAQSMDRFDSLHKDKEQLRGTPTGFRDLDDKLAGFQDSDLIILAARPAMGKTSLALSLASNIACDYNQPTLIFSLEMSQEQLTDRIIAARAGIEGWKLRTGNLDDQDFSKITSVMGDLAEAPLYIDDSPSLNVMEMRTKARRLQMEIGKLGLVIVDYLQLMNHSGSKENRVQEISAISRGLKSLAREINAPVLALSQLSRSVESRQPKIPQLADLRESGSIEQDADVVLFIYRDEYYNPKDTEKPGIADILLRKHRNGPTGSIELYFNDKNTSFRSLDRKYQKEEQA
ncbi:replicative DNA helicase [Candidatus Saccharibacteria bacterium]|nr:replicative DNA helicase [Candidatus Saccharibacteria bacterium]MCB9834800.1 replicative DNA helicase [Candidatus Nomurabacteria bacterium]